MAAKDFSSSSLLPSAGRAPAYSTPLLNHSPLPSQTPPLVISLSQLELVDHPLPRPSKPPKLPGAPPFSPQTPLLSISLSQLKLTDHPVSWSSKPPKVSGTPPFLPGIVTFPGYSSRKPSSTRVPQKKLPSTNASPNRQPGSSSSETLPLAPPLASSLKTLNDSSNLLPPEQRKLLSPPSLFNWSPSSNIVPGDVFDGSPSSREPAFFDMHLHEDLLLKKVVFKPDLATQIGKVADLSLKMHGKYLLDENGPLPEGYPTERFMKGVEIRKKSLGSELDVQTFYKESIAEPCLNIASTLVFGVPPPDKSILTWSSKSRDRRAIADGFLSVNREISKAPLFENLRVELELLADCHLNTLAVWEFKSLSVGKKAVMDAILWCCSWPVFPWKTCTPRDACNTPTLHPVNTVEPIKTGRKTSPDTQSREWKLGLQDGDIKNIIRRPREADMRRACCIIQQVWAEAVQSDATFLIINAGQYELIGLRHRKTQTLYFSDVIKVCESNPAYGKLHTGLYIAAFQDALDRAHRLRDIKDDPNAQFPIRYRHAYAHDNRNYKHYVERPLDSDRETGEITGESVNILINNVGDVLQSTPRTQMQADLRINDIQQVLLDSNGTALDPAGIENKGSENVCGPAPATGGCV